MWTLISALIVPLVSYAAPQTWTIGNDEIKRSMSFSEASGLLTEQLSDLRTHTDFVLHSKPHYNMPQEFSFQCNGHSYSGSGPQFALVSAGWVPLPNGKSLTLRLRSKELALEVSVIYTVYDGHPAIRKHLVLRNPAR